MKWINPIMALTSGYLLVFLQTCMNPVGWLTGTQADLLPVLMVYAGLSMDGLSLVLLALMGGLWLDSFSLNPLGISVAPLLVVGWGFHGCRDYILRDQTFAQMVLGGVACVVVAVCTLLLITIVPPPSYGPWVEVETSGVESVAMVPFGTVTKVAGGWRLVEHIIIMGASGALLAPVVFRLLDWIHRSFDYPSSGSSSFRPDREIKRGSEI